MTIDQGARERTDYIVEPGPLGLAYVAGKMRGVAEFGFPAFHAAAARLRDAGWGVFNPAEYDEAGGFDPTGLTGNEDLTDLGFDLRDALGADLAWITARATAVAVLPGWEDSKGARAEVATAVALGLDVIDAHTLEPLDAEQVLAKPVARYVNTDEYLHAIADERADEQSGTRPGEVARITSATGAQKGAKECRIDLIPPTFLHALGVVFGRGAVKYAAHNWLAGYPASLSLAACFRHLNAYNAGEDIDPDQGVPHLAAAAFHLAVLLHTTKKHPEYDDRPTWGVRLDDVVGPTPQWLLDAQQSKATA